MYLPAKKPIRSCTMFVATLMLSLTFAAMGQRPSPPDPTERPQVPPDRPVVTVTVVERVHAGWASQPLGAVATAAAIPVNTIHMYQDANFDDDLRAVDNVTGHAAGVPQQLGDLMEDSLSSMRWNLLPGVVVVFYEDDGGKGEQLAIWGKGEMNTISRWNFNDKASSWAWYYAGGSARSSEDLQRGASVRPNGTAATSVALSEGTVNMYRDKDFRGDVVTVDDVTLDPHGQLNKLPADMNDKITSLRWNLPPGVVVTFYQDGAGEKQQASIWGRGEVRDGDVWDVNDKISRWSWNYIGSPEPEVLGYTPPTRVIIIDDAFKDSVALVASSMEANKLGITASDLSAMKNPTGEGTFVYVPRTQFDGVERHLVWVVVDDRAYAVTGPAKMVTPGLPSAMEAEDLTWSKTGISKINAEEDSVKIVFP